MREIKPKTIGKTRERRRRKDKRGKNKKNEARM